MVYNGHPVIADTFLKNRPNHGQTLIEKPLYSEHFCSGHFFCAPRENFGQNLPFNSGHRIIGWEKENTCMFFLTHFFVFT